MKPGGPEVPGLSNLLGGEGAGNGGDLGPPNLKFVEQNTRDMMQSNSDYKVPSSGKYDHG